MDLLELQKAKHQSFRRHPWELARKSIVGFLIDRAGLRRAKVVDVGSGDAYIAQTIAASAKDFDVAAVDINYTSNIIDGLKCTELTNIKFYNNLQAAYQEMAPFQGILLMDILEHLQYPACLLRQLKESQGKEVRFVFVTVPAFQYLFGAHDTKLHHYRRYSRAEIASLLKQNGFEVKRSGYFFQSLLLIRLAQKFTGKSSQHTELYNWKGNKIITSVLQGIFMIEFFCAYILSGLRIHLPGLTAYVVCKIKEREKSI